MTKIDNKIIVALDVPEKKSAVDLVVQLRDQISFFKIGLQLYTAEGPALVREIVASGVKVFLDLKLHDIPNTVARAVESASELGVQMLTIHLSGGSEMIRAASTARKNMSILGVTLLTSATEETLREIGIKEKIDNHVLRLAELGLANEINGIVASPHELPLLRRELGDAVKIVVPGIRPSWSEPGDQKRFMTPREAIDAGADYIVIGRPITAHPDPGEAVAKILEEISA
ncbi:MAG: orotidine-5-phosphate decarboxylase [Verrucomicrobiota bacterium]|jgi:orotidine-5'-phosphate decarboxylase